MAPLVSPLLGLPRDMVERAMDAVDVEHDSRGSLDPELVLVCRHIFRIIDHA